MHAHGQRQIGPQVNKTLDRTLNGICDGIDVVISSIGITKQKDGLTYMDVDYQGNMNLLKEAKKEGIASILSVPIVVRQNPIGALRVYSAEPWKGSLEQVNLVQAVAQIAGMALEMSRLYKGLKDSIEILKAKRDPKTLKYKGWTPYEGVPKSAGRVGPISQRIP